MDDDSPTVSGYTLSIAISLQRSAGDL